MAHPYNNKSPFNCWKGYERVPGKAPGTKGSCRKSSPVKAHGGTHLGEGHDIKKRLQFDQSNRERYDKMPQRVKDSLQQVAYEYGGPFFSPKHQVNVDPEDGVLYNRPIYSDGTMLTYPALNKPVKRETELNKPPSPMRATKGGGTTKVCLPKSKVNSMSTEEKKKVVSAKESAGRAGKRERSQRSEVKGARKKGATLKDWFEKENWVNVKTGDKCGAPTKMDAKFANRDPGTNMTQKEKLENRDLHKKRTKGGYNLIKGYLDWDGDNKIEPWELGAEAATWLIGGPVAKFGLRGANRAFKGLKGAIKRDSSKAEPRRTIGKGKNFNKVSKDKSATGAKAGGGMTQKGVNEYKRKNPGSKLQTAVTEKPSELKPGSKKAKRRKSFCARSKGWTSERGRAARRRWNC